MHREYAAPQLTDSRPVCSCATARPDAYENTGPGIDSFVPAATTAAAINEIRMHPAQATRIVLQLQRQYGNRYVQRVVALARQANGEAGVIPEVETSEPARAVHKAAGDQHEGIASRHTAVQFKLEVSQPGDPYEQEADRIAEQVISMPQPRSVEGTTVVASKSGDLVQRQDDGNEGDGSGSEIAVDQDMPSPDEEEVSAVAPTITRIDRMCAKCEEEQEIHAKGFAPRTLEPSAIATAALQTGGKPLDLELLNFFEPRFGYKLDKVRVHTDTGAATAARNVNALAFTVGNNIAFGSGQYEPETTQGRRLLAHELTHVIQQNPDSARTTPCLTNHAIEQPRPFALALQRWHADGPAPGNTNTIVCDGGGGVRTQLGATGNATQTACLSDCIRRHEESHRADALAANPTICQGADDATQVTFNGEQRASEFKAYGVEIACLQAQLPTAGDCTATINARIAQITPIRESFR